MPNHRTVIANVLVIGSGAAGLRAAIAAHEAGCEVLVVGKRPRRDAHTVLAAGGVNAAFGNVDPQDSWQQHFADTYQEAYFISNPKMVEVMVKEAPGEVMRLVEWGAGFAKLPGGRLDQRYFGAHTYRRTCYAGDYTGREMLHTLDRRADRLGIRIVENQYISRLLTADGACFGAFGFDVMSGERTVFLADAVVLAAGGHTRLWRRSSSRRDENTGDGMTLALEAGCELMDMELVQFHPTGMVTPEDWSGTLVTEAVRGEGGYLRNRDGERFMQRYDPERMELSTRDRVAMAVYTEIMEGRGTANGGVYLDISHRSKEYIVEKLPRMYRQFLEAQMLDISRQPMEVAPTAHYSMGGVVVDTESTATSIEGLYAAGEVTAGLHGANRLGGNSLAETLVFGRRAGEYAAQRSGGLTQTRRDPAAIAEAHAALDELIRPGKELARPLQRALRNAMWESGGVTRAGSRIEQGLDKIAELREAAAAVDVRPSSEGFRDLAVALDLHGSLWAAEATLRGALARRESRGAHQRVDFPQIDPMMQVNFVSRITADGTMATETHPTPPLPEELRPWIEGYQAPQVEGRLLE